MGFRAWGARTLLICTYTPSVLFHRPFFNVWRTPTHVVSFSFFPIHPSPFSRMRRVSWVIGFIIPNELQPSAQDTQTALLHCVQFLSWLVRHPEITLSPPKKTKTTCTGNTGNGAGNYGTRLTPTCTYSKVWLTAIDRGHTSLTGLE